MPLNDYIALSDLQARLSPQVVQQILDDANIGTPDGSAVTCLIRDACAKMNGNLFPVYAKQMALPTWAAPYPDEVVRLTLDIAEALAARRHPEAVKRDWRPLMDAVERELAALRRGETRLNLPSLPPEPDAATATTAFRSGLANDPTTFQPKYFADGTGDF